MDQRVGVMVRVTPGLPVVAGGVGVGLVLAAGVDGLAVGVGVG